MFWQIATDAVVALLLAGILWRCLGSWGLPVRAPLLADGKQSSFAPTRGELWKVFALAVAFRAFMVLLQAAIVGLFSPWGLTPETFAGTYHQWDAEHYIGLAELGYNGYLADEEPIYIVFFPLYVWITRLVSVLVGNTTVAGVLVSCLCFSWGCCWLYRLAAMWMDRGSAAFVVLALSCWPYGFFFGLAHTESLFLLTTSAALFLLASRRWGWYALWGALAALTGGASRLAGHDRGAPGLLSKADCGRDTRKGRVVLCEAASGSSGSPRGHGMLPRAECACRREPARVPCPARELEPVVLVGGKRHRVHLELPHRLHQRPQRMGDLAARARHVLACDRADGSKRAAETDPSGPARLRVRLLDCLLQPELASERGTLSVVRHCAVSVRGGAHGEEAGGARAPACRPEPAHGGEHGREHRRRTDHVRRPMRRAGKQTGQMHADLAALEWGVREGCPFQLLLDLVLTARNCGSTEVGFECQTAQPRGFLASADIAADEYPR